ncbi:MAG: plastocyanin/azurin family copper-binding protein [Planctomycetota bacterium]|nr:plastocyanin/azurin family copper-binding protein [Planctomycetota bacterium]
MNRKVGWDVFKGFLLLLLLGGGVEGQEAGSVSGFLDHRWAERYPALVYLEAEVPVSLPVASKEFRVDQKDMTFVPRVAGVLLGQSVRFLNSDFVRHNVYSTRDSAIQGLSSQGTFGSGESYVVTLDTLGVVQFRCNLHSQMVVYLVVRDNPYFSVSKEGRFEIGDVPPGRYVATFFHEKIESRRVAFSLSEGEEKVIDFDLQSAGSEPRAQSTLENPVVAGSVDEAEKNSGGSGVTLTFLIGVMVLGAVGIWALIRGA